MNHKSSSIHATPYLKYKKTLALMLVFVFSIVNIPWSQAAAVNATFGFDHAIDFGTKTVRETVLGETLVCVSVSFDLQDNGALSGDGLPALTTDYGAGQETQITFSITGGKSFDLISLDLKDMSATNENVVVTSNTNLTNNFNSVSDTMTTKNVSGFTGITSFTITASDGHLDGLAIDNIVLQNILPPLPQVSGVSLDTSGNATWNDVANEASYDVQLYKGGTPQGAAVNKGADTLSHSFLGAMRSAGVGTYTVRVTAKGDGINYCDGLISNASGSQTVAALSTVTAGLNWTGDTAHWTGVANAISYDVQLLKDGSNNGSPVNVLSANAASGVDFSAAISSGGPGTYTYKVTAKSDPASLYFDAAQSAASANNTKLAQVSSVSLNSSGNASWTDIANEASYDVQLYKGGLAEGSAVNKAANTTSHDFLAAMRSAGAGDYTVKVTAKGNGSTSFDGSQSAASNSQSIIQLATVSGGLTWTGDVAHWTSVANAISYDVQLLKESNPLGGVINVLAANAASGADFSALIAANSGGNYSYTVTAKGNSTLVLDASPSAASANKFVATPLAQVVGVALNASGLASWTDISNESSYDVQLFKGGTPVGAPVNKAANTSSHDFLATMRSEGNGIYTVKVTAKGDGVNYSDAPQSAASGSQTIDTLSTVSAGLTWTGDTAHWTGVANHNNYDVQLFKNGSALGSPINVLAANVASGADFSTAISAGGPGTYTYKVTAKADPAGLYLDGAQSAASNNNIKLAQVTNASLSSTGVATWDDISNEASYDVQLFKNGNPSGAPVNKAANTASHDFLTAMRSSGAGVYTVKVTAKGDTVTSFDGLESVASNSQTIAQLATVTGGLTWTGNTAHWTAVANATSYDVQLFKEGNPTGSAINVLAANASGGADFSALIASSGGGNYSYKVTAKGTSTSLYLDANPSASSASYFVATPLAQVTGVNLNGSGLASWTDISNESSYDVQLFKDGNPSGSPVNKAADTLSHNFLTAMRSGGPGVYTVKVTAKGDTVNYSDAPQSVASSSQTIATLAAVSAGLTWTGDTAHWSGVSNANNYDVQLFKNGSATGSPINVLHANVASGVDFSAAISAGGPGTYTYKVTAKADPTSLYLDGAQSAASNNNIKLAQVTNVSLSNTGVASWDDVANESGYDVQLFKDGTTLGAPVNKAVNASSHDFLAAMRSGGTGVYTVKVTATGTSNGPQSTASNSRTIVQLATANAGNWSGQIAQWTAVPNALSYDIQLFKGGVPTGAPINVLAANISAGIHFGPSILASGTGTYTFKITAKGDSLLILDAAISNSSPDLVITTLDAAAPTPGGLGVLSASNLTTSSVKLNWTASTDNVTSPEALEYKIVRSLSNNITTLNDAESNGTIVQNWTPNMTSISAIGLNSSTTYYFNVLVRDSAGNQSIYVPIMQTTATEILPPSSHAITFVTNGGSPIANQLVNHGQKATRPANPTRANYSFINWYSDPSLSTLFDFNTNITGALSLYAKWSENPSRDTSSDSSPTPNNNTSPTSSPAKETNTAVIINGEVFNIGKELANKTSDGKSQATVSVDKQSILKQIEAKENTPNNSVQVNVNTANADRAEVGLTGDIIKSLENKNFDLSVQKDNVNYTIPAKEFTIDKIADTLNVPADSLQKIEIKVLIKTPSEAVQRVIETQIQASPAVNLMVPAVEFELNAITTDNSGTSKNVSVSQFSQYVDRTMAIPAGIDPSKITTGIVFNKDGSFEHVPTLVYQSNNQWFAQINSRTNSIYSLVYHPITVSSVENHWSKVAVNDMASRLVITSFSNFKPDEAITRAEFTDYIVRGLGLFRKDMALNNSFKDVSNSSPYQTSIAIAKHYGLVQGYANGNFNPNDKITREEAMVILSKSITFTHLEIPASTLNQFSDTKDISKWALADVQKSVSAKIFNGKLGQKIKPHDTFTKAEAAMVIRNLLIEAKLINSKL